MARAKKKPAKRPTAGKTNWAKSKLIVVIVALLAGAVGVWLLATSGAAPVKKTATIVHLHSSGKFDGSNKTWKKELQALVKKHKASVVTLTEARGREEVTAWEGWGQMKGESKVIWNEAVWENQATKVLTLADKEQHSRSIWVGTTLLEHKASGEKWLWVASHLPAGIDGGNGKFRKNSEQVAKKWRLSMKDLASQVAQLQKEYSIDPQRTVIVADWNINIANKQWRKTLKGYFPDYTIATPGGYRGKGTLGSRTIDTSLVASPTKATNWKVLTWKSSGAKRPSDHRPVLAKYQFSYIQSEAEQ